MTLTIVFIPVASIEKMRLWKIISSSLQKKAPEFSGAFFY
jgi:hypothetical protein